MPFWFEMDEIFKDQTLKLGRENYIFLSEKEKRNWGHTLGVPLPWPDREKVNFDSWIKMQEDIHFNI